MLRSFLLSLTLAICLDGCDLSVSQNVSNNIFPSLAFVETNEATSRYADSLLVHRIFLYCKKNKLDTTLVLLTNMYQRSGSERMQVVNLQTGEILEKGLVAHGHCQSISPVVKFSNEVGSNCTSVGHYKIGGKYNGNFGTAYKLIGLDSTNCNAMKRFIVLHSHRCVPASPVPYRICRSEGCPTVSPDFLKKLEKHIDKKKFPVLLYVYCEDLQS